MFRGQFTRWPDMCLSAKVPSSCQQLKEHGLHLDGGRWGRCYHVLSCLLLCATPTSHRRGILHLCIVERNSPTPVRRRLSLTYAGLEKDIPDGAKLTSAMNE